jgi:hypothetical protein
MLQAAQGTLEVRVFSIIHNKIVDTPIVWK